MKPVLKFLFLMAAFMPLTGCISWQSHAVGVETNAKFMASPHYEVLGESEGTSSSFKMFWVLPVTPAANCDEAVNDAIKRKGGDNLIEAVFTREREIYIVGTVESIYVKGKVIRYIRDNKK